MVSKIVERVKICILVYGYNMCAGACTNDQSASKSIIIIPIAGKWSTVVFNRTNIKGLEHEIQDGLYCEECLPCCSDTQYSVSTSSLPLTLSMRNNSNLL